jgi:hypothetical protein
MPDKKYEHAASLAHYAAYVSNETNSYTYHTTYASALIDMKKTSFEAFYIY